MTPNESEAECSAVFPQFDSHTLPPHLFRNQRFAVRARRHKAPIGGTEAYSAQTISRIARGLDAAVEKFHRRALRDEDVYLFLDWVVLKVREGRGKVRRRVVLVAYGITLGGRREVLAYRLAQGESEAAWTAFLQDLYLRGLQGRLLRLVISDGSTGFSPLTTVAD